MKPKITILKTLSFLLLLILLVFPINCKDSADEDIIDPPQTIDVQRLQIIVLDANGAKSGQTYNAAIGTKTINLMANDDDKLTGIIPLETALGNNDLSVTSLGVSYKLNIKDTQLVGTAQDTMSNYFTIIDNYSQALDDSTESNSLKNDLANFKKVFQNAKEIDQKNMALFYQANKAFYNNIVSYNFDDISGKSTDYDENFEANVNLNKHKAAVLIFAISNATMILAPDPLIKVAALTGILISMKKALEFGKKFINEKMVFYGTAISEKAGAINLISDVTKTLILDTERRSVISNDSGSAFEKFMLFFKTFGLCNSLIEQKNDVARWCNQNIPFANFEITPVLVVPQAISNTSVPINNTYFKRYAFSLGSPQVSLVSAKFNSAGKIDVNAKITDTALNSVSTTLDYRYKDDYNSFSGSVPIVVTKNGNILEGIWIMDFTLAPPDENCDETDLEDEDGISPTFHFGENGKIVFDSLSDPNWFLIVNNPAEYTNTYNLEANVLKITTHYLKNTYGEEMIMNAVLTYDSVKKRFSGNYSYQYFLNGRLELTCNNLINIYK